MIYIENDGALFRGPSRSLPKEVWFKTTGAWQAYKRATPTPIEWGTEITEDEAKAMMVTKADA